MPANAVSTKAFAVLGMASRVAAASSRPEWLVRYARTFAEAKTSVMLSQDALSPEIYSAAASASVRACGVKESAARLRLQFVWRMQYASVITAAAVNATIPVMTAARRLSVSPLVMH